MPVSNAALMNDGEANTVARWEVPSVMGPSVNQRRVAHDSVDRDLVVARESARAEGYQEGTQAALAEHEPLRRELQDRVARLDAILQFLSRPLQDLDSEVEGQLVALSMTTARQLLRRELKTDPAQVVAVIRETVGMLPAAARDVRVHLHPEDAALVRERLAATGPDRAWSIVEDPVLARGGCRVATDTAQIDARIESRIQAVMSSILGDERGASRTEGGAS
jgi:flagellar assembly protein FliH